MTRSSRVLLLVVPLLAALTGVSTAAPPAQVKGYSATASSAASVVTVVLRNEPTSTSSFGSAEVRVPTRAGLDVAAASVARSGWSAAVRSAGDLTVVRLVSGGKGTTNAVAPGSSVALSIPVPSGAPSGSVQLTTQVKQSNDFSGTGNDFTRTSAEPSVTVRAAPAPAALVFGQGPSDVQVSPAGAGTAGATPVTVMCPAPTVRVVDASGATVTSLPPTTVTLRPVGADPGLELDGSPVLARDTSSGVATFGDAQSAAGTCASGLTASVLGLDHRLTATAVLADGTRLESDETEPFDVLSFYAVCAAECATPVLSAAGTTAQATATGGADGPDRLVFTVDQDQWTEPFAAACGNDVNAAGEHNPHRKVVTIDVADRDKTVQLRWDKQAVQWATNNGTPLWQVCMAAEYEFPTPTTPATPDGVAVPVADDTSHWYVGALLPCAPEIAGKPCLVRLARSGGEQVATVSIPDVPGDPRMI